MRRIVVAVTTLFILAYNVSVDAQSRFRDFRFRVSGTVNGEFFDSTTFTLRTFIDSTNPRRDIIVSGSLPDPASLFPGRSMPLDVWKKIMEPPLNYIPPILCAITCLDPSAPDPCGVSCANPNPNDSPAGIDEVFAASFSNGDIHEGITNFNTADDVVIYQFNARLQPGSPNFVSEGVFVFPRTTKAGAPIEPSGKIVVTHSDGRKLTKKFQGLVLLKNRDGRLLAGFRKTMRIAHKGLDFVIEADIEKNRRRDKDHGGDNKP